MKKKKIKGKFLRNIKLKENPLTAYVSNLIYCLTYIGILRISHIDAIISISLDIKHDFNLFMIIICAERQFDVI